MIQGIKSRYGEVKPENVNTKLKDQPISEYKAENQYFSDAYIPTPEQIKNIVLVDGRPVKLDGKPFSAEDTPYIAKITDEYIMKRKREIYEAKRSIFKDHKFSDDEYKFFMAFSNALKGAGFSPAYIDLWQYADGAWGVSYERPGVFLGRILTPAPPSPTKYAVKKSNAKRALRVFYTMEEAHL